MRSESSRWKMLRYKGECRSDLDGLSFFYIIESFAKYLNQLRSQGLTFWSQFVEKPRIAGTVLNMEVGYAPEEFTSAFETRENTAKI